MVEIAKQQKISKATAYFIVRQYLPRGSIRTRTKLLKEQGVKIDPPKDSPDDVIRVVPAKPHTPKAVERNAVQKGRKESLNAVSACKPQGSGNWQSDVLPSSSVLGANASRTLTFGSASLRWEGDPPQIESFCGIMRAFRDIFEASL